MPSPGDRSRFPLLASLLVVLVVLAAGLVWAQGPPSEPPGLDRAIAAQEGHTDALLASPGVVGTAVGLGADGRAVVKIYTRSAAVRGLPAMLDGVPVEVEVTGELVAQSIGESSGTERLIKKGRSLYCTTGTLGALVTDGTDVVYALSNAHVYANAGSQTVGTVQTGEGGDRILQPGRVDMTKQACGSTDEINNAVIGNLWAYSPIVFSRTANNVIDAAIAKLSESVANATPAPASYTPSSATVGATLQLAVKKYGRTTGLTEGTVTGINAAVIIKYDKGSARFVQQIVVQGSGSFSAGGDSGSLIVTSNGNHPVALLFAGSSSTTIGNPIDMVLDNDNWTVSIVGTTP